MYNYLWFFEKKGKKINNYSWWYYIDNKKFINYIYCLKKQFWLFFTKIAVYNLKVDLLNRNLWTQGMDSVHGMCIMNTEAVSAKRDNKKKYIHACLNKSMQFTPFSASVDGLLGSRWRWHLNIFSAALQQSGRNRIHVPAGTWRV